MDRAPPARDSNEPASMAKQEGRAKGGTASGGTASGGKVRLSERPISTAWTLPSRTRAQISPRFLVLS